MKKWRFGCIIFFLVLSSSIFLFADTIELKSGGRLEGKITQETDESVTIDLDNGSLTISRSRIVGTVKGETPLPEAKREVAPIEPNRKSIPFPELFKKDVYEPILSKLKMKRGSEDPDSPKILRSRTCPVGGPCLPAPLDKMAESIGSLGILGVVILIFLCVFALLLQLLYEAWITGLAMKILGKPIAFRLAFSFCFKLLIANIVVSLVFAMLYRAFMLQCEVTFIMPVLYLIHAGLILFIFLKLATEELELKLQKIIFFVLLTIVLNVAVTAVLGLMLFAGFAAASRFLQAPVS